MVVPEPTRAAAQRRLFGGSCCKRRNAQQCRNHQLDAQPLATISPLRMETSLAGDTLLINAAKLTAADSVSFDSSQATCRRVPVRRRRREPTFSWAAPGSDSISGGLGADQLAGGGGDDRFLYKHAVESTGADFDTIIGFDASRDVFDMPFVLRGLDAAVTVGSLSAASFETDLAAAWGPGFLGARHAVVFTASQGAVSRATPSLSSTPPTTWRDIRQGRTSLFASISRRI